ncbi:MAG: hypothetical protein OEY89_08405 [Gammaproteobacteria bacterium]|nr:hypothetical protein [Gammaproteobacteria bacterium]
MKIVRTLALLSFSLFILVACSLFSSPYNEKNMLPLAAELLKASAAVESTVRYKKPDPALKDRKLLMFATQHDPELAIPFESYEIKIYQQNRHALVLVCSADGARGLLEDAGCTKEMDRHRWQDTGSLTSCEPVINLAAICSK